MLSEASLREEGVAARRRGKVWMHFGGKHGFCVKDGLAQGLKDSIVETEGASGSTVETPFQLQVYVGSARRTFQDGVLEAFINVGASGAGGRFV